jgi:hypothetical protein
MSKPNERRLLTWVQTHRPWGFVILGIGLAIPAFFIAQPKVASSLCVLAALSFVGAIATSPRLHRE